MINVEFMPSLSEDVDWQAEEAAYSFQPQVFLFPPWWGKGREGG